MSFNAIGGTGWVLTIGLSAYAIGQTVQNAITALGFVGLAGLDLATAGVKHRIVSGARSV